MTGDGGEYLRAEDLRELGDDSLPGQYLDGMNYLRYSLEGGGRMDSSFSPTHHSFYTPKHQGLMEDLLSSHQVSNLTRDNEKDSYRLSWGTENLDNVALSSSPIPSGRSSPCRHLGENSSFLVSFMVDARGGAMRGCRHNGLRILVPPKKCSAPTRVTCRLVKRHRLATMPPLLEGEGLASRLVEVGPSGAQFLGKLHLPTAPPPLNEGESLVSRILQLGPPGTRFLGPVVVEIPHFAALRGTERELVVMRSEGGDQWKEHQCDHTEEELNQVLNGMDEELDSPQELERKRICRIITRDFPQYFAVVSRVKQDSELIGPEGGVLSSTVVPAVRAAFPQGALTKKIRVGLQAQPMSLELVRRTLGSKAAFSPIVTLEPRRRKFHKPITMTLPVPETGSDPALNGFRGDAPSLRLLCSITGGTTPAQWEDITGTTPLTFTNDCVSFTTNVSARFWLVDCRQAQESVNFSTQVYREVICVPYMAKFVVFAKTHDPIEARLRCFCMTDDRMEKSLEQQELFTEVARSRDVEVLEGKPIYADCCGNLVPLTKSGQHHLFSFYAFKENRLALFIKVRDSTQEPCGRLSFMREPRNYRALTQNAICNLNISLPSYCKDSDSDQEQESESGRPRGRYEETETSVLKSELIRDPDLLSDVSEMKQDLIKMTAILIADPTEKSRSLVGSLSEKGAEEVSGGPLERMEKDLEKVKEDLEKVSEILRGGAYEGGLAEDWILLSDGEVEEARRMATLTLKEPVLRETRANKGAPRPKAIKDSGDLKEYLPASSKTKARTEVHENFTDVVLRKSAKPTPPKKSQDESSISVVRKPVRRKGKDPEISDPSETDGHLGVPATGPRSPISPVIEETPIGSIRDKVKALQQKVEAEQKTKKVTGSKPSQLPFGKILPKPKESPKSKQGPPKSPKAEQLKPEETMSVKALMQAFQTGQESSKRTAGLLEVKTPCKAPSEDPTKQQTIDTKCTTKVITTHVSPERELSMDSKPSKEAAINVPDSELTDTADFGHGGLDDSPDSLKHEGVADSRSASPGDGTPHLSSEDSYKHEGLATPSSSPESLSLSPKNGDRLTKKSEPDSATVQGQRQGNKTSAESGIWPIDEHNSTVLIPVPTNEAADEHSTSESIDFGTESKPAKARKLTKTISETLETFLSDEEGPDNQLAVPSAGSPASRSFTLNQGSLDLPLRRQDSDALSPLGDDSLTISHRDSLEGSPVMEENSSQKSPDSIEPSPTRESPCRDSLENSPTEQTSRLPFPPHIDPTSVSSSQSCRAPEFPPDALRSRLRDCEASAEDDSCEQTSQMTSSGKSPLSPDTPSSEEVSYEVNPRSPDPMFLPIQSIPTVIPEDPEEDMSDSREAQRKITPEEEMFKMAAKIKTFDEMDQDARSKQNSRKHTSADLEIGDDSYMTVDSMSYNPFLSESGLAIPIEDSGLAVCIDSHIKIQPPSPFPAGGHEEINKTSTTTTVDTSEGPHSDSDTNYAKDKLNISLALPEKEIPSVTVDDRIGTEAIVANVTAEQRQESLRKLSENKKDVELEGHVELGERQSAPIKTASNITHTDQTPQKVTPESVTGDSVGLGVDKEKLSPGPCIPDASEEEQGPPKTESKGVTAKAEGDPWNAMREDDAAFAARVKEEEQKILNLMVERPSQQATPDTTPGRTPTEEGSPASEPNPFLFQEGKLFEMTRSGAIDMTKRSYEEEGPGFAFFQIREQPLEEAPAEGGGVGAGRPAEPEVGLNLTIEVRTQKEDEVKEAPDRQLPCAAEVTQVISGDDGSKSKIPKMGVSASSKSTKKDPTLPEAVEAKADKPSDEGPVDVSSSDPMMTDIQTAESTVTRSVYSEQSQESSDSSPEEPQSVVESAKADVKVKQATSANVKKIQVKPQAKNVSQGRGKPTTPTQSYTTSSSRTLKKEPSFTSESKSRIPIKASPTKSDSTVKPTDSTQEKRLKIPVKKDSRRKSETDAGPSVDTKAKTSFKAKSFCEGESTRPKPKKDQGRPLSVESAKSKGFHSRLPVRRKAGQVTPTATPTKVKQQPQKTSLEFLPEIGDEAAKLVEKLVQAEKDKEREATDNNSDDESSLVDPAVVEKETFPEVQFPPPGGAFPIRPLWDQPTETQCTPEHTVPRQVDPQDEAERREQRLAIIADHLGFSWTELARELDFSEERINQIRVGNPNSLQDQSHALLHLWTKREGTHATDTALLRRLTKINRMDIVHIIETKINKSNQEDTTSHTYAEIERTIEDRSEGFSALHEDIDSPRACRRREASPRVAGRTVPVVSAEELSASSSSLGDRTGRLETDTSTTTLQNETEKTHSLQRGYEEGAGTVHLCTFKQVSPLFTLNQTATYQLQSHEINPLCKDMTEDAEGEQWSLECLQTPRRWLSPVTCQQLDTSSRTGVCESLPISMTDFGESLTESEQAEPDFGELAMELRESREDCTEHAPGSVSVSPLPPARSLERESSPEPQPLPCLPVVVECLDHQMTTIEVCSEQHIDEGYQRLYKVIYGYHDNLKPAKPDEIHNETIQSGLCAQGTSIPFQTKGDEQNLNSVTPAPSHSSITSRPDSANQVVIDSLETNDTELVTHGTSSTFALISHDSNVDALKETFFPHDQTSGHDYTIDITLAPRLDEDAMLPHRDAACRAPTPESKGFACITLSPELTGNPYSTLEFLEPSERSRIVSLDSPPHMDLPCSLCTTITRSESRSSSPDSWSLNHEIKLLAPDSPLTRFRPLSPLPPLVDQWDGRDVWTVPQGPSFIRSTQASGLRAAETGERPLTPMVSNRMPFGRPVSPRSEMSGGGSISPQTLSFDIEDRASSLDSFVSETLSMPRSSEVRLDDRSSSLESFASLTADSLLSPDPPPQQFGLLELSTAVFGSRSSSESLSFDMEPECPPILSDVRPSSLNEHNPLSCEGVPLENEMLESTSNKYGPGSSELLTVGENKPLSKIKQLLVDDDWVWLSVCKAGQPPVSPTCGSMSVSVAREVKLLPSEAALCCPQLSDTPLHVPQNDPLEPTTSPTEHIRPLCSTGDDSMSPHSPLQLEMETSLNAWRAPQSPSSKWVTSGTQSALAGILRSSFVDQSTEVSFLVEPNTAPTEETEPHQDQYLGVSQTEKDKKSSSSCPDHSEIQLLSPGANFPEVQVKASMSTAHQAQTEVEWSRYDLLYDSELWKLISQVHDPQYVGDTWNKIAIFKCASTFPDDAVAQSRAIQDKRASLGEKSEACAFLPEDRPELSPLLPCPVQLLAHMRWPSPESVSPANRQRPLSPDSPIDRYGQSDFNALVKDYQSSPRAGDSPACLDQEDDHIRTPAMPCGKRTSEATAALSELIALPPDSFTPQFGQTQSNDLMSINACGSSSLQLVPSDTEQIPLDADPGSFEERPESPEALSFVRHEVSTDNSLTIHSTFQLVLAELNIRPNPCDLAPPEVVSDLLPASEEHVALSQTEIKLPVYKLLYNTDIWKLISKIHDPQYAGGTFLSKTGLFEYVGTRTEYEQVRAGMEELDEVCEAGLLLEDKSRALERSLLPHSDAEHISPHYTLEQSEYLDNQHTLSPILKSSGHVDAPNPNPPQYGPNSPEFWTSENKCNTLGQNSSILCILPKSIGSSLESVPSSVDCRSECLVLSRPGERESLLMNAPTYKATQVPVYRLVYDAEIWKLISQIRDPQYIGEMFMGKTGQFKNAASSSGESLTTNAVEEDLCKVPSVHGRPVSAGSIILEVSERPLSAESISEYRTMSPETENLRSSSPESIVSLEKALSKDSPVPQYTPHMESAVYRLGSAPSSPVSTASDFELEVFDTPLFLVRERSLSWDSLGSEVENRALTPDSPIPDFGQTILQQIASIAESRSPSPVSVGSDMNNEVEPFPSLLYEVRPLSPESRNSVDLCPDSLIPDFATNVFKPVLSLATSRSMSSESVASEAEYGPMVYSALHSENRPDSPDSYVSVADVRSLSPDSCSEYIPFSHEEILLMSPDRSSTPEGTCSLNELTALSPDSPIPDFSQVLQEFTMPHVYRSSSPQSLSSDWDVEPEPLLLFSFEDRGSSPASDESINNFRRLSPDSPVPDFRQHLPESYSDISCPRCLSTESMASDVEYVSLIGPMHEFEKRPDSPESVFSVNDCGHLCPDSPIPQYTQYSTSTAGVRYVLTSAEPIDPENDLETDICLQWLFEERPDSPDSGAAGYLSPDSPIPEFRQMLMDLISHVEYSCYSPQSLSSDWDIEPDLQSTLLLDEDRPPSYDSDAAFRYRLSPDSPLPQFQAIISGYFPSIVGHRSTSPECVGSDSECGSLQWHEDRPSSPVSVISGDECRLLSPYAIRSFEIVEAYRELRSISPEYIESDVELNVGECLMHGTWEENRPNSPKSVVMACQLSPPSFTCSLPGNIKSPSEESDEYHDKQMSLDPLSNADRLKDKPTTPNVAEAAACTTKMGSESLKEQTLLNAQYKLVYKAELWNLISPVHDPQYRGDTFHSQTGCMEYIGSSMKGGQNEKVKGKSIPHSPGKASSRVPIKNLAKSEYNLICGNQSQAFQYAFGTAASAALDETGVMSSTEADGWDPPHINEWIPELIIVMPDEKSVSVSTGSVNRLRPLSTCPTLPDFKNEIPEYGTHLQSKSSSQETPVASANDAVPVGLERQLAEPEHRPVSVGRDVNMVYERASSPESLPEFNENRSLPPDSPIPEFPGYLPDYIPTWAMHGSSSAGSWDSEGEVVVTSSRITEVQRRPSSPESISSVHKFAPLLPDSPVPEFMRILSSYFQEMPPSYRSCSSISPVSYSSDNEYVALPIQCWIGDTPRPLTPQSVNSEEEIQFNCVGADKIVSEAQLLSHVTCVAQPDRHPFETSEMQTIITEAELDLRPGQNDCPKLTRSESESFACEEWIKYDSEQPETVQSNIHEQHMGDIHEEALDQPQPFRDQNPMGEEVQGPGHGDHKDMPQGSDMTWPQRSEEAIIVAQETEASKPSRPLKTVELNKFEVRFNEQISCNAKPEIVSALQRPDWTSSTTHRAGTPVLKSPGSHPVSNQELSPTEVQASETKTTIQEEGEDLGFSPGFNKVLSDFETTISAFELEKKLPRKAAESLDSDTEYFDCEQTLSDFSEAEEVFPAGGFAFRISEPPSPMPGSSQGLGLVTASPECRRHPFLRVQDYKRFSSGSESLGDFAYDSDCSKECRSEDDFPLCEELPSRDQAGNVDDKEDFLAREISEELGPLSSDSSEEEVLTTRVVRRRVIIQGDDFPDIPPQTVTEEKFIDDHGNMVVKKTTRKVIRKFLSADGVERQEVQVEGAEQEAVRVEEGDVFSRVVKRTVVRSQGDQHESTFSEPWAPAEGSSSQFETEAVLGRKVSRVVKTTVVRGDRLEKQTGDASLAADLPSARDDFRKALGYAGGFGEYLLLPHVVEQEVLQGDGSVLRRTSMRKSRSQRRTVVRDGQGRKHVTLERLDDAPGAPGADALQQKLRLLLQHYCCDAPPLRGEGRGTSPPGAGGDPSCLLPTGPPCSPHQS